jgi:hypothetical protein
MSSLRAFRHRTRYPPPTRRSSARARRAPWLSPSWTATGSRAGRLLSTPSLSGRVEQRIQPSELPDRRPRGFELGRDYLRRQLQYGDCELHVRRDQRPRCAKRGREHDRRDRRHVHRRELDLHRVYTALRLHGGERRNDPGKLRRLLGGVDLVGQTSPVGAGNVYNATAAATFVNATTNFKILNTSSALNAGTTDTADIPTAIDILGTTRPQGTAWDIGAYELPVPSSAFTGGGKGGGAAVSGGRLPGNRDGRRGTAAGRRSPALRRTPRRRPAAGTAVGRRYQPPNAASAKGGGQGGGQLYSQGAIDVEITLNPLGTQQVATPFTVTGTYTVTPSLQFSDDSTGDVYANTGVRRFTAGVDDLQFYQPRDFNNRGTQRPRRGRIFR